MNRKLDFSWKNGAENVKKLVDEKAFYPLYGALKMLEDLTDKYNDEDGEYMIEERLTIIRKTMLDKLEIMDYAIEQWAEEAKASSVPA